MSMTTMSGTSPERLQASAGILALVEDPDADEIGEEAMSGGIALADWYVAEALRPARAVRTDARLVRAQELLVWLQGRDGDVAFRTVLQKGPYALRLKEH